MRPPVDPNGPHVHDARDDVARPTRARQCEHLKREAPAYNGVARCDCPTCATLWARRDAHQRYAGPGDLRTIIDGLDEDVDELRARLTRWRERSRALIDVADGRIVGVLATTAGGSDECPSCGGVMFSTDSHTVACSWCGYTEVR